MSEPEALREYASFSGTPIEMRAVLLSSANHIEKLEAALNCNLPDYDSKIGVVERLRQLGNWRVDGTKSSPIYNKSADRIEKLEAALRAIGALDIPRPVAVSYRDDGQPSKHDRCPHDRWMYDECAHCVADYAKKALERKDDPQADL